MSRKEDNVATRNSASNSLSRSELLNALNMVKPALGKTVFVPVLGHFCFDGERVTAYDDSIAISVACEAPIEAAVPGDLFLRLLGSLTADDVTLTLKEGTLHVACGKSKLKVPTLPPAAFIFKEKGHGAGQACEVSEDTLRAIERCLIATGVDPTHPAQMGLTLVREEEVNDAYYTLYSTDNVTMSRYELEDDLGLDEAVPAGGIIMPTEFCRQLVAMSRALNKTPTLTVHEAAVIARFGGDALLFGKLIQAEKPLDFAGVFAKMVGGETDSYELPPAWDSTFTRACAVVNPQHPVTSMSCEDGVLLVESKSPLGEVKDELPLDADDVKEFLVDPAHVLRASKVCSHVAFRPRAVVMLKGMFTHMISHCSE